MAVPRGTTRAYDARARGGPDVRGRAGPAHRDDAWRTADGWACWVRVCLLNSVPASPTGDDLGGNPWISFTPRSVSHWPCCAGVAIVGLLPIAAVAQPGDPPALAGRSAGACLDPTSRRPRTRGGRGQGKKSTALRSWTTYRLLEGDNSDRPSTWARFTPEGFGLDGPPRNKYTRRCAGNHLPRAASSSRRRLAPALMEVGSVSGPDDEGATGTSTAKREGRRTSRGSLFSGGVPWGSRAS